MKKLIVLIAIFALSIVGSLGILYSWESQTDEMQSQENISELAAEKYLIDIKKEYLNNNVEPSTPEQDTTSPTDQESDFDYNDNKIYSYFNESYAQGHVDCVIEIPAIDLRQSVFTGDADQIKHDLSHWLPVTARTDYVLGDTHYCIYMHNPRNKSIKISMAQDNLHVGDYMVITQKNNVYFYAVTGVFSEWRDKCSENYVNNDATGVEKLYIFTCARNEWQGKNLVIEGTMISTYSLTEWEQNKESYVTNYKKQNADITIPSVEIPRTKLQLDLQTNGNVLQAIVSTDSFSIAHCKIGIFNYDGYLLGEEYLLQYDGGTIQLPQLEEGQYYVGIYECPENSYSDSSYLINVNKSAQITYSTNEDINETETKQVKMLQIISICCLSLSFVFIVFTIIKLVSQKKK